MFKRFYVFKKNIEGGRINTEVSEYDSNTSSHKGFGLLVRTFSAAPPGGGGVGGAGRRGHRSGTKPTTGGGMDASGGSRGPPS